MIAFQRLPASVTMGGLLALTSGALFLLGKAVQDGSDFGRLHSWLLAFNALVLVIFTLLIAANIYQLVVQYRHRVIGSRMTVRLTAMFVFLSLAPAGVVYHFAQVFLERGIDSWFETRIGKALDDSLDVGRTALDSVKRERLKQVTTLVSDITGVGGEITLLTLDDLRSRSGATEMVLLTPSGEVISASHVDATAVIPHRPGETVLQRVRQDDAYVGIDPVAGVGMQVRVAIKVLTTAPISGHPSLVLQALFPINERLSALTNSIQEAHDQYQELFYLRKHLKLGYSFTLALVLLLSLLSAVWAAFFSARRLVAPVSSLARATRAVAAGDYDVRLPAPGADELGLLVTSFNDMIQKIALARDTAQRSREQVEKHRAYLETVLAHLSSGVTTLDSRRHLRSANRAAGSILGIDLEQGREYLLDQLVVDHPHLRPLVEVLDAHLNATDWRQEVTLLRPGAGRQVLMCHGAILPEIAGIEHGQVVVVDDVTTLMQAQRDAAWGEVARRLAHEIKNPLTPIQLSAERLRHKYLRRMEAEDAEMLDRLTHTIIQQVEVMKEMVKAFSEYARAPKLEPRPLLLNNLINEVMDLYRGHDGGPLITLDLGKEIPCVEVDPGRFRQLLHNLLKNALEANAGQDQPRITVRTRSVLSDTCRCAEVRVEDSGPGIPENIMSHLFEPYVTTKPKGTGLGLAIVKRIVEEHGGWIWAENPPEGGAAILVRLPIIETGTPHDA